MRKWVLILTGLGILVLLHTRGFVPYDEGWFIQAGYRLFSGQKPYTDFSFLYNPGGLYVNAIGFWLFGKSIFASRMMALGNAILAGAVIVALAKKWQLPKKLIATLVGGYIFWGAGHLNFVWPVMWCLTTAIGTVFILDTPNRKNIFLAGILAAVTFIFKQNFGLAIILAVIGYFILTKYYKKTEWLVTFGLGYGIVIFIQIIYFLRAGIWENYLREFWGYTVEKIFLQGILNSPWLWEFPQPGIIKLFKIIFYLSPLFIGLMSLMKILKMGNNRFLFLPLVTIFYYLLSIRPTTDYVHLTPLIALAGLNFGVIYLTINQKSKKVVLAVTIILTLIGGYSTWGKRYYRWNTPLIDQNVFVANPRVKLFTDDTGYRSITALSEYFAANLKNEKEIFIYNFAPVFYFILDKQNPTGYDYVHSGVLSPTAEAEIIFQLETKRVNTILTNIDLGQDKTSIARYIEGVFLPVYEINEYTVWQRSAGLAQTSADQLTMNEPGNR